jgi:alpha-L-rhamnosidase
VYRRFGDAGVLAARFDSMRGWVDRLAELAGDSRLWDTGFQYGDWLDPAAPPDHPDAATTAPELVATAYFARSAELLARSAAVLGRTTEEAHYLSLAQQVRRAFHDEYVTGAGRLLNDSATGYALALSFGLLPTPEQRAHAGRRLAALVRQNGYRIATGFVGTPLICDALTDAGELDAAYRLLLARECPSWLYPVTMGATTVWERWDSLLPDGTVNPGQMTSFNHYALGAVADWLHRTVAGLAPAAPGYRELAVRPRPGGGLRSAAARLRTPYGPAACSWRVHDGQITVEATVPPTPTAHVTLPDGDAFTAGSGAHTWTRPYGA